MASATVNLNDLPTSLVPPLPVDIQAVRPAKWAEKIAKQGPWNEVQDPLTFAGAPSLPMPVEVLSKESLAPFFTHLSSNGTHEPAEGGSTSVEPYYNTELIEFENGVLYADGRVDLCKMGTGPRNIADLMESIKSNTFAKHLLLGNNIIGPTGVAAVSAFIKEFPHRFETWYLAGNCIDPISFTALVDAMIESPIITNVWLKRNTLTPAAAKDVFRLINLSPSLRTLDLDQTELGDAGVAELFTLLRAAGKPCTLRHIYMNACGISKSACEAISSWIASPICQIQSLYMSNNPIGDAISVLAPGLKANTSLERLLLQSCGLKEMGCSSLFTALQSHPTLKVLDIGQAYSTYDLGMRYNWITDVSSSALANLISSSSLNYLNISYTPMTQSTLNRICTTVISSPSLVWFAATPLVKGGKSHAEVKAGQEFSRLQRLVREHLRENVKKQYSTTYDEFENGEKRFLLSPRDVRFIDSVYRNRDAGVARRGLKQLEKHWDEGDDILLRVAEGSVD